jgi:tRNA pseudouridine55 synthase
MIDGILLIDKEEGITSYDVIRKLKKSLPKGQKIGHAGTLDPFATGLLVILLGKGTKLMEKFHTFQKRYTVKAEFGYATDTQDLTGIKIAQVPNLKPISKKEIQDVIESSFKGEILQLPPIYSAKKIHGQKAYTLARQGQEVSLERKEIRVDEFTITEYAWPFVTFNILCSTGTYVRTLIDDLGRNLDSLATAVSLRRECIGNFVVTSSIKSKDIEKVDIQEEILNLDLIRNE